jgi:uncharacterized membrane protein
MVLSYYGGMAVFHPKTRTDKAFEVALWFKGAHGLLETLGGLFLLFVHPDSLARWLQHLTAPELSQDPHDFFATHILHYANGLNRGATLFAAIYLLAHGLVKLVLVVSIMRDQLWAYPGLIIVTGGFIVYQLYHIVFVHITAGYIQLTVLDGVVMWLTWVEYGKQKDRLARHTQVENSG